MARKPKQETKIAVIAAYNKVGEMLFGQRRDNGRWTTPAGHLEEGESPEEGARRELAEEAGLKPDSLEFIGEGLAGAQNNLRIYCFRAEVGPEQKPDSKNDPDEEVEEWKWVDPTGGLPPTITENLHARRNILLRLLGLQDGEVKKAEEPPMKAAMLAMMLMSASAAGAVEPVSPAHPTWTTDSLSEELRPIAYLESYFGVYTDHKKSHLGDFHTAFGPLGFKPATAWDYYRISHRLQYEFPDLDKETFTQLFKSDWRVYNRVASVYWSNLRHLFKNDHERMAYAWHQGTGAAEQATEAQIKADDYVQRYLQHLHKSEKQWKALEEKMESLSKDEVGNFLTHPLPSERMLALKHPQVAEPHLIRALYDQDPRVAHAALASPAARAATVQAALVQPRVDLALAAIRHPSFDHRHVDQALQHSDPSVVREALNTRAVTPDQLDYVLQHPGYNQAHKVNAAMHVNNTPAILYSVVAQGVTPGAPPERQELAHYALNHSKTPLRALQLAASHPVLGEQARSHPNYRPEESVTGVPMSKNIGDLLFPKLGYNQIHQEPMTVRNRTALESRLRYAGVPSDQTAVEAAGLHGFTAYSQRPTQPTPGEERMSSGAVRPPRATAAADSAKQMNAVVSHEVQHGTLGRIAQDHGRATRRRVVDTLVDALQPEEKSLIQKLASMKGYDPEHREEHITQLHQYLQDPAMRQEVHARMGLDPRSGASMQSSLRLAWHKLRARAATLAPSEVGIDPAKVRVDPPQVPKEYNPDKEFQKSLNGWLREEMLDKAQKPEQFRSITRALDPNGPDVVDHKPHLEAHPEHHKSEVLDYRHNLVGSPHVINRTPMGDRGGITSKVLFTQTPAPVLGIDQPVKYMVKPYHERIIRRVRRWVDHPIQGWAEMANQAVYHAAGIGHMHQHVHVTEHNMGPGHEHEPALVIKMEHDLLPAARLAGIPGRKDNSELGPIADGVRKIGLMDYLTNNLDRHWGNLMVSHDPAGYQTGGLGHFKLGRPVAIDHSRSFQYSRPKHLQWSEARYTRNPLDDGPGDYIFGGRSPVGDLHGDMRLVNMAYRDPNPLIDKWQPVFDWYAKVAPQVEAKLQEHLQQIKVSAVRDHVWRNFKARSDHLQEMARMGIANYGSDWWTARAPMHQFGEETEDEVRARAVAAYEQMHAGKGAA